MTTELWRRGAADLAEGIRTKQFSSREVVQAHLDRIAAVNRQVNAVTVVLGDSALEAADAADRAVAMGLSLGPLHGVPFTVKDNIEMVGTACTQGVAALKDALPPVDAPQIAQLKAAGAIPIGRTNLPNFGLGWDTANSWRGATRNPWDPTRTPGGSCGGEAAAIATGMSPLGVGNDSGGSLRWPAQCCGIAGLRPTLGRVPAHAALARAESSFGLQLFLAQGPLARHIRDLRLALASMSSMDVRDPWWVPTPLTGQGSPQPRSRAAMVIDPLGIGVDADVAAGIRSAADALTSAGYAVEEIELPDVAETRRLWQYLLGAEMRILWAPAIRPLMDADARRSLDQYLAEVPEPDLPGYMNALATRNQHARRWNERFTRYDIVLGPVSTLQPFKVGFDSASGANALQVEAALGLTLTCNRLGLPAVAVPVGVAHGLPQAVQIIGARFEEWTCLDAAESIEAALGTVTPIDPIPGL